MMSPIRARGCVIAAASLLMVGITFMAFPPIYSESIELDPAFLVDFGPARRLGAEEDVEFLRRRGNRRNASLVQAVGDRRIGHGANHVVANFLHDSRRGAGGCDEAD